MKKRIIVDGNSTGSMLFWSDRFSLFFHLIKEKLGFDIRPGDTYGAFKRNTAGMDLILAFACEQRPNRHMQGLITLDKNIKLILYMHDVHWAKIKRDGGTTELLRRADLVMVPYYTYFKKVWPQFIDKAVFFPHFFASQNRYCNLKYNADPKMKCLLSGNIKQGRYPIRWVVYQAAQNQPEMTLLIDILRHPRHSKTQFWTRREGGHKKQYARTIHEYFCSVIDSSKWKLLLTKYFEIPATGALLLADEPQDCKEAGLIAGEHYVEISNDTVLEQVKLCLKSPEAYEKIRKEGMKFVRANHGVDNRLEEFKKILERVI